MKHPLRPDCLLAGYLAIFFIFYIFPNIFGVFGPIFKLFKDDNRFILDF